MLAHVFAYKLKDLGVRGRRVVMKKFLKTVALLLLSAIFITSCDKEEDDLTTSISQLYGEERQLLEQDTDLVMVDTGTRTGDIVYRDTEE